MAFTFDLIVNPIIAFISVVIGLVIGYFAGRGKAAKAQRRIDQLETEMMNSHAEILEIQKAYVQLEQRMKEHSIPVISMKLNGSKENPKEKASK